MRQLFFFVFALTLAVLTTGGCEYVLIDDDPVSDARVGKLVIFLTDAPGLYAEVNIQIDRVEVHSLENGWQVVNTFNVEEGEGIINLLALTNGVLEIVGERDMEAGTYDQVRMILTNNNNIVLSDGSSYHLMVPSGEQSGLKIHHEFDIVGGETYELLLDFDAHRSIVSAGVSGIWLLKPVIRVQAIGDSGSLKGRVEGEGGGVENAFVKLIREKDGKETPVTQAITDTEGGFVIAHVAPVEYWVEVEAPGFKRKRLENPVSVPLGVKKDLGVINLEAVR